MTGPFYRGVKRTFSAPVTGSPSSVTIVIRDPSGNEASYATALNGSTGLYDTTSLVILDEGGTWWWKFRAFMTGDATNPVDSVAEPFKVHDDPMTGV
jgi:hypothetical protein